MLNIFHVWGLLTITILVNALSIGSVENAFLESYCGRDTYGSPRVEHCQAVLSSFADSQDNNIRVFDEEELRTDAKGSWPGVPMQLVDLTSLNEVIQIPRYLSFSTCYIINM